MGFYKNINVIPEFQSHHEYPVGTILNYRDRFIIEVRDAWKEGITWDCRSCEKLCIFYNYCHSGNATSCEVRCSPNWRDDHRTIYYKELGRK